MDIETIKEIKECTEAWLKDQDSERIALRKMELGTPIMKMNFNVDTYVMEKRLLQQQVIKYINIWKVLTSFLRYKASARLCVL